MQRYTTLSFLNSSDVYFSDKINEYISAAFSRQSYFFLNFQVIQRQSCTTKSDVWAVGVITYILLAGYPPFHVDQQSSSNSSDADALLMKKIVNCDYKFIESTWKDISPQAIDFIQSLMCPDPNSRH